MQLRNLPLGYTISTRCTNWRAVCGFIACELAPFAVALRLAYGVGVTTVLAAFIGHSALYECGYVFNDLGPARDTDDTRPRVKPDTIPFCLWRCAAIFSAASIVYRGFGARATTEYCALSVAITLLLLGHSTAFVRASPRRRVISFCCLALYKYAPYSVPFAGLRGGCTLLMSGFLAYGLARVVVYALRKLPPSGPAQQAAPPPLYFSLIAGTPALILGGASGATALVGTYWAVLLGTRLGALTRAGKRDPGTAAARAT